MNVTAMNPPPAAHINNGCRSPESGARSAPGPRGRRPRAAHSALGAGAIGGPYQPSAAACWRPAGPHLRCGSMAETNGHGPVLIAYDGSDQAKAAIREAGRQLGAGRKGIVLSVWEPISAIALGAPPPYDTPELEHSVETDARQVAEQGAELARSAGFDATATTERGSPVWNAVVQAADHHDVDLVVMGSHGRTGLSLILLGSVASAVSRHTDRPVLIVHTPADRA